MRRSLYAGLAALVVVPVAAPLAVVAEQGVELRYKFGAQDELIYRTSTKLNQTQTVNGQEFKTVMENSEVLVQTLEKVGEDGELQLKTENKRLQVQMEVGPLGKYEFDSKSTERDKAGVLGAAVTPLYESLSGAYLWMTITPRGDVVSTKGYAELVKGAIDDNPLASQFAGGGTDAAHRAGVTQRLVQWPKDAIAPGHTWDTKLTMDLPKIGKVEGRTTYTFDKIVTEKGRRIAEFTIKPELSADIDLEQMGAKITGRLQSEKAEGRIRFDIAAGRLVSKHETYTISGTLNVAVAGQNLQIPMKQTQSVKVDLLDELPE